MINLCGGIEKTRIFFEPNIVLVINCGSVEGNRRGETIKMMDLLIKERGREKSIIFPGDQNSFFRTVDVMKIIFTLRCTRNVLLLCIYT